MSLRCCIPLMLAGALLLTGCSNHAALGGGRAGLASWERSHGGLDADDHWRLQAQHALARIEPALDRQAGSLHIHVLSSQQPKAFAWPGGDIYVSVGLIRSLTSDELTAAVAHEAAHLLNDAEHDHASSLAGMDCTQDHEELADEVGVKLLARCGLPRSAMRNMLLKVQSAHPAGSKVHDALAKRIARLGRSM